MKQYRSPVQSADSFDKGFKTFARSGYINENESSSLFNVHTVRLYDGESHSETQERQNTNLLSTLANNSESRWSFAWTRIDAKVTAAYGRPN